MKAFLATSTLLIAGVMGAAVRRDTPTAQVALSNDQTGAYGSVAIPLDNQIHKIPDLYANTGINQNGQFLASSANLVGGLANNPTCNIFSNDQGALFGTVNSQKTFAKFGGSPDMLVVEDLTYSSILCHQ